MLIAMKSELHLRARELPGHEVETIYFGGGTPSLLAAGEIHDLIGAVQQEFHVNPGAEITLEANPDDLSTTRFSEFAAAGINRLSIGVQSFRDEDLKLMNRAHNASEALQCMEIATSHFENISLDLIYGIPGLKMSDWKENLNIAVDLGVQHISSYALTVEPKTALKSFIEKGLIREPNDEEAEEQFHYMVSFLQNKGFIHYELSNFGKPGFFSRNNSSYWLGKPYLGIGPSAHSFDGKQRSWNVANNPKYVRSLREEKLPITREILSEKDRYNEYVMTGLRTIWGVSRERIKEEFGEAYLEHFSKCASRLKEQLLIQEDGDIVRVSERGKFLSDGIASELFMVNLTV